MKWNCFYLSDHAQFSCLAYKFLSWGNSYWNEVKTYSPEEEITLTALYAAIAAAPLWSYMQIKYFLLLVLVWILVGCSNSPKTADQYIPVGNYIIITLWDICRIFLIERYHQLYNPRRLRWQFLGLQFVLKVLASLFLILIITKVIMLIAERIGKEFGFGDMIIKCGAKLTRFFSENKIIWCSSSGLNLTLKKPKCCNLTNSI